MGIERIKRAAIYIRVRKHSGAAHARQVPAGTEGLPSKLCK